MAGEGESRLHAIRLIVLDRGGTRFGPEWRVSEAGRAAVIEARDRGDQISLATLRWYGSAQTMAQDLELRAPPICRNRAHVMEPGDNAELLRLHIPPEVAREIAALCDEAGVETHTTVDGVTHVRTAREAQLESRQLPQDMRLARSLAEYAIGPASGLAVSGREPVRAVIEPFAERCADVLAMPAGVSGLSRRPVTITAARPDKVRA